MNATSRRMRPSPRRQNLWSPRPSTQTWPLLGRSWPWMRRKSVVLPAPLGPVISTSSPLATVKLTSVKTTARPNDLLRCAMRTAGGGVSAPLVAGRETALPLLAGFSIAATRSESVARAPLETTPRCPTLSISRLAHKGWKPERPAHIGPALVDALHDQPPLTAFNRSGTRFAAFGVPRPGTGSKPLE